MSESFWRPIKMPLFATPGWIGKYVGPIFADVKLKLSEWSDHAAAIPDQLLRDQALASIRFKTFHALGGAIFALYPGARRDLAVQFIVALQTISDYLDNLCDRAGIAEEAAFRQLHYAMTDAVDPADFYHDYYRYYPCKEDAGYLLDLVKSCKNAISELPAYRVVQPGLQKYTRLYSELQIYKHLDRSVREDRLKTWAENHLTAYPGLYWWEFAAATGSTLGMFLLFAAAADPRLSQQEVGLLDKAYFPWIHGLHILLDYFIDSEEDIRMGDLNFVQYYAAPEQCQERLVFFLTRSLREGAFLDHAAFHRLVVRGLLAMYLSDPKAFLPGHRRITNSLLNQGGIVPLFYHKICRLMRQAKVL